MCSAKALGILDRQYLNCRHDAQYHAYPGAPTHLHYLQGDDDAPSYFMGEDLRAELMQRHVSMMQAPDPDTPGVRTVLRARRRF
jgi:hypothetical protein